MSDTGYLTRVADLPVFTQVLVATDRTERELQVWRAVVCYLDVVDYRVVYLATLETTTAIAKSTLSVALERLCALGYLVRRRGSGRDAWEYRVPLSRAPASAEPPPPVEEGAMRRPPRRHRAGMVSRGV